jgi:hypothetical protein
MFFLRWQGFGIALLVLHFVFDLKPCAGQAPQFAGIGPTVNAGLGYTYLNANAAPDGRISEQGLATSLTVDFPNRIAAKFEATYTKNSGALGLRSHNSALAYMAGPVFYAVRRQRFAIYGDTLFGAARIAGAVPPRAPFAASSGWVNDFAWSIGGGFETRLSRSTSVRTGVDYLRAKFLEADGSVAGRGNVRITVSFIHVFGGSRDRLR